MRSDVSIGLIVSASVVIFMFVAPVVTVSKPIGSIATPGQGCAGLSCGISSFTIINEKCYQTIVYHFLGSGAEVCYYENVAPSFGGSGDFALNSTQ